MKGALEGFSCLVKRWWPVGVWMAIILAASTEWGSASHSYQLLRPLLLWWDPGISEPEIYHINLVFRKVMHVVEFAGLALIVWRVHRPFRSPLQPGGWRLALLALGVAFAFGVGSELVQSLFPESRGATLWDVVLDMGGAILGLLGVLALHALSRRYRKGCEIDSIDLGEKKT